MDTGADQRRSGITACRGKAGGLRPDICSEKAAACFTEITHHAYAKALGTLSEDVQAIFTDEPDGCPDAVSDAIYEQFRTAYGYSLQAYPEAVADPENLSAEQKDIRRRVFGDASDRSPIVVTADACGYRTWNVHYTG